ncbi:flagellin [Halorhabdus amylolytica]|uniref:flagellin n=1 Tax=Halorhabdus amylolytica TaxID=2559573 RepID=UPI0010A9C1FD|nr:flagellin [Halorhabdus amylolytica]
MGFSVSASVAILFAALLIGFGMFHSAAFDTVERVTDARSDARDDLLAQQNTAINLTAATYDIANDTLHVYVDNTGATTLTVSDTDLLVDNRYQTTFNDREVSGDSTTDLWQPGETLHYNATFSSQPGRVKVITDPGVSGTEVVVSG